MDKVFPKPPYSVEAQREAYGLVELALDNGWNIMIAVGAPGGRGVMLLRMGDQRGVRALVYRINQLIHKYNDN